MHQVVRTDGCRRIQSSVYASGGALGLAIGEADSHADELMGGPRTLHTNDHDVLLSLCECICLTLYFLRAAQAKRARVHLLRNRSLDKTAQAVMLLM